MSDTMMRMIELIKKGECISFRRMDLDEAFLAAPLSTLYPIDCVPSSPGPPYPPIQSVPPIIYAILCEKPEFVEFFLSKKVPLDCFCQGWCPLHYASYTRDHRCLEVLLSCDYIQTTIEVSTDSKSYGDENLCNNSLHIAVTNRRYKQVYLLLKDRFIKTQFFYLPEKTCFSPIYVNLQSISRNTPLHISVFNNDKKMCQLLLSFGADPSILNSDRKAPLDLSYDLGYKEVAQVIEKNEDISPEDIIEENHADIPKIDDISPQITINELAKMIFDLRNKLETMEKQPKQYVIPNNIVSSCSICGNIGADTCPNCHKVFCDTCIKKSKHSCMLADK